MSEAGDMNVRIALSPEEGDVVWLGVRFMIDGALTGGAFALIEHPIAPHALAAAMHTHRHEDEYIAEIAPLLTPANAGLLDEETLGVLMAKYGLEMNMSSVPVLVERYGLVVNEAPSA